MRLRDVLVRQSEQKSVIVGRSAKLVVGPRLLIKPRVTSQMLWPGSGLAMYLLGSRYNWRLYLWCSRGAGHLRLTRRLWLWCSRGAGCLGLIWRLSLRRSRNRVMTLRRWSLLGHNGHQLLRWWPRLSDNGDRLAVRRRYWLSRSDSALLPRSVLLFHGNRILRMLGRWPFLRRLCMSLL